MNSLWRHNYIIYMYTKKSRQEAAVCLASSQRARPPDSKAASRVSAVRLVYVFIIYSLTLWDGFVRFSAVISINYLFRGQILPFWNAFLKKWTKFSPFSEFPT